MSANLIDHLAAQAAVASIAAFSDRGQDLLGRIGSLEVRLARDAAEIACAQRIRFRIFHEEFGASFGVGNGEQLDIDRYDAFCDHLLVLDRSIGGNEADQIVGTYRLLRQERAAAAGGFYSEGEYELSRLVAQHPAERFLELGRSCVLPAYRGKRTIEILWQGIWAYVHRHDITVMTGCASFPGIVPAVHAEALSFLAHHCRAEGEWSVRAVAHRFRAMDMMPVEAVALRSAMAGMPPLIKGYLRLGAKFGEGCVVDHEFGTTDVLVVLPVNNLDSRYVSYYSPQATRFAA